MNIRNVMAAFFVAAASLAAQAADPPKCRMLRIAEWPVRFQGALPVIDGEINGRKIGILLDTGAYASLVTKDSAERLGLATRATNQYMQGVGGQSQIFLARIEEFRIGDAVRKDWRVRVGGERPIPGVDFILGDDFFKLIDLEFDYAKGVLRLFTPENCDKANLAYWDPKASQVPLENADKIVIPVKVNGREGRGMLDSGASGTVISLEFAREAGVTRQAPGVLPSHCSSGLGAEVVASWVAPFESVTIGDENIRNPQLRMHELLGQGWGRDAPPDLLLGTDFLRSHRVLVSRSQNKVYFSYTGGLVFTATAGIGCEGEKDAKSAAASREAALAANPENTTALLQRAMERLRQRDNKGAIADLDVVVRLEPGNPVGWEMRANARANEGDYDGAVADTDAAIAKGTRTAAIYVNRARMRRSQDGNCERALAEYDQALALDPLNLLALRGRGFCRFYAGRLAEAEKDYLALVSQRPNGVDSMWLALSRERRGESGKPALEEGLAKLGPSQWPAPLMRHLLGRLDLDAVMDAAGMDPKETRGRVCEARFYTAAWMISAGKAKDARLNLLAARDQCPRNFIEYNATVAELAKLP